MLLELLDAGLGPIGVSNETYITLFYFYLALTASSALLYLLSWLPFIQFLAKYRFGILACFTGCVLTYLISLLLVFLSPEWDDNGVTERLVFPDHLGLAFWLVPFLQFLFIPAGYAILYFARRARSSLRRKR